MRRLFFLALLSAVFAQPSISEELFPQTAVGRWVAADKQVFLGKYVAVEITRCNGDGFCARIMTSDKCDDEQTRLNPGNGKRDFLYDGRWIIQGSPVKLLMFRNRKRPDNIDLMIEQYELSPLKRALRFHVFLARDGKPHCNPAA